MKTQKYKCPCCDTTFIVFAMHWRMYHCPKCKKVSVDLEEYDHCVLNGKDDKFPIFIEEFKPPIFMSSDDYHSAMLSWLNDSDELYTLLIRETGPLFIIKLRGQR